MEPSVKVGTRMPITNEDLLKPWIGCIVNVRFTDGTNVEAKISDVGHNSSVIVVTKVHDA